MRHSELFCVPFGDCDPAGIVYYPRYFEWFHDLFERSFAALAGVPYATLIRERGIGFPVVQLAVEYRAPVRFGDRVALEMYLSDLGEKSGTFEYRVRREGALCATASVKVCTVDLRALRSIPFPAELRECYLAYLEPLEDGPETERLR